MSKALIKEIEAIITLWDESTGGHETRTREVVRMFSRYLILNDCSYGMDKDFFYQYSMHDLGEFSVDENVLRKQGKFTEEKYEEMKRHSVEGANIIKNILKDIDDKEFSNIAKNVAHYHHEKWNGKGYPCGLKGDEIPLEARIMALADVFDALVSESCYKKLYSFDKAFAIIEEELETHFDSE